MGGGRRRGEEAARTTPWAFHSHRVINAICLHRKKEKKKEREERTTVERTAQGLGGRNQGFALSSSNRKEEGKGKARGKKMRIAIRVLRTSGEGKEEEKREGRKE